MTVAMLVVVAVQVNWLESSAKLRKEVDELHDQLKDLRRHGWCAKRFLDENRSMGNCKRMH